MGGIEDVDLSYFTEYKNACIEMGYTIESETSGTRYEAFNAEGYELSLGYYNDKISITLHAPDELSSLEWPTTGLGARLPIPASSLGKVTSDSSKSYVVIVGDTTLDDYKEYVKACEEKGFTVDYHKQDTTYEADDADGYRLNTRYLGFNRIEVTIQVPKDESENSSTEPVSTVATAEATITTEASNDIRPEFKEAMDSYESFMDEYVAFMNKYSANPTDLNLLADYADFMSKYADFVEDFEKWDDANLNAAETEYYIEVQARVNQKLLEIVQ